MNEGIGLGYGDCVPHAAADPGLSEVAGPVKRFLRRVVGPEHADDVASETMLALLEHAGGREVRRPVSYALRVAWNKAVDLLRLEKTRGRTSDPAVLDALPASNERARIAELREWLNVGLARLGAEDRAILHLRYDEGLDYRDLSRALGVPVGTVGRRLHDARHRLASELRSVDEGRGLPIVLAFLPGLARRSTTLSDALGLSAAHAPSQLSLGSWWVLAMSKKLAVVAVLVLLGAGGLAWWLMRTADVAAVAPASAAGVPAVKPAVATPPVPGTAPSKIEARPFEEDRSGVAPLLTGRVVDFDGAPIAGARVHLASRGGGGGFDLDATPEEGGVRRAVVSGPDGAFQAGVEGLGCTFDVLASAAGFAPSIVEAIALSGPPIEIRLGRGMAITGTVRDFEERPVGGARVTFRGLAGRGRFRISTVSDANGRFNLTAIPDPATLTLGTAMKGSGPAMGESHLIVEADGFASQRVEAMDSPFGDAKAPPPFDIRLSRGGIVEGIVRDAADGAPIADAEVVLWTAEGLQGTRSDRGVVYRNPFGSRIVARTRTDAAGRYEFDRVPAAIGGIRFMSNAMSKLGNGRQRLGGVVAHREGFAPGGAELGHPNAEGERQTIDLALKAATAVTGRVVDEKGRPIPGARVFCVDESTGLMGVRPGGGGLVPGEAGTLGGSVLSDADGRFRHPFAPVPKGGAATVKIYACGCDLGLGNSGSSRIEARAGVEVATPDLVLKVGEVQVVEGDVRDESGRPIAGAVVSLEREGSPNPRAQAMVPAQSDRRGRFRCEVPLPPKSAGPGGSLLVAARGCVSARVAVPAPVDHLAVVLKYGLRITGRAVRPDGTPVGGAEVRALALVFAEADAAERLRAPSIATARSDVAGVFTLEGVPADPVLIVANVPGEGVAGGSQGPLVAPARDVTIILPAPAKPLGAIVRFRVLDAATGKAWLAAVEGTMTTFPVDGGPPGIASGKVEGPGRIHFRVAPGTWDVRVDSPGYATWVRKGLLVDETATEPIEVRLGGGGTLEGKVVTASGPPPLEGVVITGRSEGKLVKARTLADGTFSIRGIDPGKWELTASDVRVSRQLVTPSPITVEVGGGAPASVEIPLVDAVETRVFIACKRKSGTATAPSGRAPFELHVVLEDSAGRPLADARPGPDQDLTTFCGLWAAPQMIKVVVRLGDRVLGSAEGVAGNEIRMTVDVD